MEALTFPVTFRDEISLLYLKSSTKTSVILSPRLGSWHHSEVLPLRWGSPSTAGAASGWQRLQRYFSYNLLSRISPMRQNEKIKETLDQLLTIVSRNIFKFSRKTLRFSSISALDSKSRLVLMLYLQLITWLKKMERDLEDMSNCNLLLVIGICASVNASVSFKKQSFLSFLPTGGAAQLSRLHLAWKSHANCQSFCTDGSNEVWETFLLTDDCSLWASGAFDTWEGVQ